MKEDEARNLIVDIARAWAIGISVVILLILSVGALIIMISEWEEQARMKQSWQDTSFINRPKKYCTKGDTLIWFIELKEKQ